MARKSVLTLFFLATGLPFVYAGAPIDLPGRADDLNQGGFELPERPGDERQRFPEIPLEKEKPPADIPLPPPPPAPKDRLSGIIQVNVKKIELSGNRVFDDQQLAPITGKYENKIISSEDLFRLRNELTKFYIDGGYINSGAVIPDQQVKDGIIRVNIVEGALTEININGNEWLNESYVAERLKIGSEDVLNINNLQNQIKLLHQDRLIERINAELTPGAKPGDSILNLRVEESRPFRAGVAFNNHRAASIGELQGQIYGSIDNLTGFGDSLSVRYALTDGLDNIAASYAVPITSSDTRLRIHYEKSDADVVEEPFDQLDIRSKNESFGITLSHPFYRTPQTEFNASIMVERRRSESFFFGIRQGFSEPPSGLSKVTVFRIAQEWIDRSASHVFAARSTFNWGVDLFNPTIAGNDRPDGKYFAWLGQFQWVQRLGNSDIQLIVRTDLQLTPDRLLPLEKFGVGGARTVRGYRENQMVRDNGAIASLEIRIPVFRLPIPYISSTISDGRVQLAGFYDFGYSENTDDSIRPTTISSAGVGVRWDPHRKIHSELYWGIPFRNTDTSDEHELQDSGIHFALNIDFL